MLAKHNRYIINFAWNLKGETLERLSRFYKKKSFGCLTFHVPFKVYDMTYKLLYIYICVYKDGQHRE